MNKKILITGWNWMLAHDFNELFYDKYNIYALNSKELDITNLEKIEEKINEINPDIVLNFAAYTAVDDAEDIWRKINYDVNTLWAYNLAKITNKYNIWFITISTDYVFGSPLSVSPKGQGELSERQERDALGLREVATILGYNESDKKNPINQYWMAKYLGEELSKKENKNSIIIRTSWLYWWWKNYKNFVNTMINLWNKLDNLKVINDQFWNPTNCKDLSFAIWNIIDNIWEHNWKVFHFSNETSWNWITWYDFAKEIFKITWIKINLEPCTSEEFPTKAKRPAFSKLINNSDIILRDWKSGLEDYLDNK